MRRLSILGGLQRPHFLTRKQKREERKEAKKERRKEKRTRADTGNRRVAKRAGGSKAKVSILSLPNDIIHLILQPLQLRDVIAVSETCHRLREAVYSADEIWREVLPYQPGQYKSVESETLQEAEPAQRGRGKLAFRTRKELPVIRSPYLDRLKAVVKHGEYSITHSSWLIFLGHRSEYMWGYVTLGSELNDIAWGNDEDGADETYWTRCKSSYAAALHRCWWFQVSTGWTIAKAGCYRAFVVVGTDRGPVQISSLNQVGVLVESGQDGNRSMKALGLLLGSENRVIAKGGTQETVLHVSVEFNVATDGEKIAIYLMDPDTTTEKKSTRIYGMGIIPAKQGSECTDSMRQACVIVYQKALGFAQGSDESSLARHISFRSLSRAGARFRRRISFVGRTSDLS